MPDAIAHDRFADRRGAVVSIRHGRRRVAHYGSAAGELAACVRAVGLADRGELSVLALHGSPAHLAEISHRLLGTGIAPGGSVRAGEAWWCRPSLDELLVVGEADVAARLGPRLRNVAYRFAGCRLEDRTSHWSPIGVVGRNAPQLLAAVGAYGEAGDPRSAPPLVRRGLAGVDALWLLESDHAALALVARGDAGTAWRALEAAGRWLGIARVGREALDRWAVLERARLRDAVASLL